MKKIIKNSTVVASAITLALGIATQFAFAVSPAGVVLGTAGNFAILAKTGISTTGTTAVTGDMGVSPAQASYITGFALSLPASSAFSTSALVTGKVYAPGYADPTPSNLTTAVLDMQNAYTDASGRAPDVTELGAGNIGGLTIAPGVYKWGTGVTIPTDLTLSGGANDVWIFQVAQNLNVSSGTKVILSGGAQSGNIFWVVGGQTTIGTSAVINGNILDQTTIVLNTGARLYGRALAQAAVTLDASTVSIPTSGSSSPLPTSSPIVTSTPTPTPTAMQTPTPTPTPIITNMITPTPTATITPTQPGNSAEANARAVLQMQLNELTMKMQSLQAQVQAKQQVSSASNFGQQVKMIAINLRHGSRGTSVTTLQQFLITQGKGSASRALSAHGTTKYFGELTRAALAEYQASVGISPPLGNFGPLTRAYMASHY